MTGDVSMHLNEASLGRVGRIHWLLEHHELV